MLALLAVGSVLARPPAKVPAPPPMDVVVADLVARGLADRRAYDDLTVLSVEIGHRIAGSRGLEQAVAFGVERMNAYKLAQVRAEPVAVPAWVRGAESAQLVTPRALPLAAIGLGGTVATTPAGLEAEVIVVGSFEALSAMPRADVEGKIVLFDVPFTSYGETVRYRWGGASAAARQGAVGVLVRSVTPLSLHTPHTGSMGYDDDVAKIPAMAVSIEDAVVLHRLADRGLRPRVRMLTSGAWGPDAPSANVIGEVRGREFPNEIVVLGCHLDSWDVGQGAQDDGAGCVGVLGAAALIRELPVAPRRTVRVVWYTNEENGLAGGKAYAAAHANERHVAALESDLGAGAPIGFHLDARSGAADAPDVGTPYATVEAKVAPLLPWLAPVGALTLAAGHAGADVGPLIDADTLGVGWRPDDTTYWPIHHTWADTIDKVDPAILAKHVAAIAAMAYVLAELPEPPVGSPAPRAR